MWTFFQHYRSSFHSKGARGFTLVELLVVVGVVTIVTTFLLFNQGKFSSSTLLRSLAYSVALTARQAQVFGTTVRAFGPGSIGGTFARGYGIYISAGNVGRVDIFADLNGNGVIDISPVDERLSGAGANALVFGRGYFISRFCGVVSTTVQDCYPSGVGGGQAITALSAYFTRPDPDACFATNVHPDACAPGSVAAYTGATIEVRSSSNTDARTITISSTGQIVVDGAVTTTQ